MYILRTILAAVMALSGFTFSQNVKKPFKISMLEILSLTGNGAGYGKACQATAQFVVDVVNSQNDVLPDYQIEPLFADDAASKPVNVLLQYVDAFRVTNGTNKAGAYQSPVVVGAMLVPTCKAIAPIFPHIDSIGVGLGCGGTDVTNHTCYPSYYTSTSTGEQVGPLFIKFVSEFGKWRRIALIAQAEQALDVGYVQEIQKASYGSSTSISYVDLVLDIDKTTTQNLKNSDSRVIIAMLTPELRLASQGCEKGGIWDWPERKILTGLYCVLEPLELRHQEELRALHLAPDAATRYQYVYQIPSTEPAAFEKWFTELVRNNNLVVFAVIDKATGKLEGKQHFVSIDQLNGVVEIGGVLWGPNIARTRVATEAFFLMASYVFDELHYRCFKWASFDDNEASKKAALRFGFTFEAVFREHWIHRGQALDTAWFSMLRHEWLAIRTSFEQWLKESNFDDYGQQKHTLSYFRNKSAQTAPSKETHNVQ